MQKPEIFYAYLFHTFASIVIPLLTILFLVISTVTLKPDEGGGFVMLFAWFGVPFLLFSIGIFFFLGLICSLFSVKFDLIIISLVACTFLILTIALLANAPKESFVGLLLGLFGAYSLSTGVCCINWLRKNKNLLRDFFKKLFTLLIIFLIGMFLVFGI